MVGRVTEDGAAYVVPTTGSVPTTAVRKNGRAWREDGAQYVVLPNAPYIFAKSNVSASRQSANAAGDATSSVLATVTLPAGLLAGSTSIYVYALYRVTSSGNTKTIQVKVGGTSFGTQTLTTTIASQLGYFIHADNASNDQKLPNNAIAGMTGVGSTMFDGSKDCSVAIDITFECNWAGATSAETITLESYMVIVYPDIN